MGLQKQVVVDGMLSKEIQSKFSFEMKTTLMISSIFMIIGEFSKFDLQSLQISFGFSFCRLRVTHFAKSIKCQVPGSSFFLSVVKYVCDTEGIAGSGSKGWVTTHVLRETLVTLFLNQDMLMHPYSYKLAIAIQDLFRAISISVVAKVSNSDEIS